MMQKMSPYILIANQLSPTQFDQNSLLADPQLLNSYSYSENSPITKSDPSGKQYAEAVPVTVRVGIAITEFLGAVTLPAWAGPAAVVTVVVAVVGGTYYYLTQSGIIGSPARGLPPEGVYPPGYNPETWKTGPASRPSEVDKGGQSLWSPDGGEWRYYPGDDRHNPHWDHNPWKDGKVDDLPGNQWRNVPINGKPPVKPDAPTKDTGSNSSNKSSNKK
jgi:hypothetical protein